MLDLQSLFEFGLECVEVSCFFESVEQTHTGDRIAIDFRVFSPVQLSSLGLGQHRHSERSQLKMVQKLE